MNYVITHSGLYFNSWSKFGRPVFVSNAADAFRGSGSQMLAIAAELIRLNYYPLHCASLDTISTTGSEEGSSHD